MGNKPLSLGHGEAEHVLSVLEGHAEAEAETELAALVGLLAGEPRALLCRNPVCKREAEETTDLDSALHLLDLELHAHFNTLELAAAHLLIRLYALIDISGESLRSVWRQEKTPFEAGLYRYLQERDGPEVDRIRSARREGGKQAALRKQKLHSNIRNEAQRLRRQDYDPRSIATILARKYEISPRQIRRILSK
jgi:hypothetical protein